MSAGYGGRRGGEGFRRARLQAGVPGKKSRCRRSSTRATPGMLSAATFSARRWSRGSHRAPQEHGAVLDHGVDPLHVDAGDRAQPPDQLRADLGVAAERRVRLGFRRPGDEGLQQVGPADDAENLAVLDDRHPLDAPPLERSSTDLGDLGIRTDADHVGGHHVLRLPTVGLDELSRRRRCGRGVTPAISTPPLGLPRPDAAGRPR